MGGEKLEPLQQAFDAWVQHGKPTASYVAQAALEVRGVRILQDEITPQSVEILRSFVVDRPPFQRVRLMRAVEREGRVLGWTEFYLLGGEHALAGTVLDIHVEEFGQDFSVPHFIIVPAYVVPIQQGLEDWSDARLADFVVALHARTKQDTDAARKNVAAAFHAEDELVSATVVAQAGQFQIRLGFGLIIWPDLHTTYDYEAQPVAPSLRHHLKGQTVLQPNTPYPAAEPLVAICRDIVAGRISEFAQPAWEPALAEHVPRRLVKIALPSGVLAFSVGLDCAGRTSLGRIIDKLKARTTGR